jgi:NAD-dependent dihydropyrimidine dehydrogenase PreA subunit
LYEKSLAHPSRKGPRPPNSFVEWFDLQNHTKFDKELGDEYFAAIGLMLDYEYHEDREKAIGERIASGQPQVARILARWKSIEHVPGMLPGDDVREFLKANTVFGLIKCACRRRYKDRECQQPDEVCLVMGRTAQAAIDRGTARRISYVEAFHLITDELAKYPVVHVTSRTEDPKRSAGLICNCHADCCVVLRMPMVIGSKYPVWEHYAKSRFRATVNPAKCSACGLCVQKRCQFKATRMRFYPEYGEERAWVNEALCMGCGCCVETCSSGARGMKIVEPPESLELPSDAKGLYLDGVDRPSA